MQDQTLLVLGDFMLDEYLIGSVERISPEAPVPVVLEEDVRLVPGGAGNVVRNLRSLNARVYLLGLVGKDEGASILKDQFAAMGVNSDHQNLLSVDFRPTTRKTRIMAGTHQMLRLDRENNTPIPADLEDQIIAGVRSVIKEIKAIIISDYDKGLITPRVINETVRLAREYNVYISVDPQVTHFDYYRQVDILTPNHHEAGRLLGRRLEDDASVYAAGLEILQRLEAQALIITRGDRGMSLFCAGSDEVQNFPTMAREVFDVTGAGDTVIAVFSLARAAGASNETAVMLSNRAAGLVVAHVGATTVSPDELKRAMLEIL